MTQQKGLTLIELMITISIASILLASGLPAFNHLIEKNRMVSEVNSLHSFLQVGRTKAIEGNVKVTICPSSDGKNCTRDWSNGYILFIDENADRTFDENETLIRKELIANEEISLRWRAFGVKTSLQWHQSGITNHQNGLFEFCYKERPKLARALIVSKSGRIRHSIDNNGNEIHEDSSGEDIVCSYSPPLK